MSTQENRNNRIIEAILEKEKTLCPGTVALIGIYGSFQTGDIHPLSDLDLLILINDDRGWKLGTSFIQDDLGIGHDIYCTNWESLREDAGFLHPHISKLMDSRIVYCADEKYRTELEMLRDQVRRTLAEPFGENDCRKAENELKEARCCYADAMIADDLNVVRSYAGGTIYFAENAVALLNKTYFRKGVKRRYEELNAMERRPENLCWMIEDILRSTTVESIKEKLSLLMKAYEEMFSNWHGKMIQAAELGDRHLAFMSLVSLNQMLSGIGSEVDIGSYDVLSVYDPGNLRKTAEGFETILKDYLREYDRAGLVANRVPGIDAFIASYLESGEA